MQGHVESTQATSNRPFMYYFQEQNVTYDIETVSPSLEMDC